MGIDIAFLAVMAFAFYRGYSRGLIMAVFTAASYVAGTFIALHFSFLFSKYISGNYNIPGAWLPFIAFALIFAVVVLIVRLAGKFTEKAVTVVIPTSFNRFLGSVLYLAMALIIFSLLYDMAITAEIVKAEISEDSNVAPHLSVIAGIIRENTGQIIPLVKELFNEMDLYFEEAAQKISV